MSASTSDDYSGINRSLAQHYSALHKAHGDDFKTAQYSDRASQEARFSILASFGITPTSTVLDFGCGLGDFLGFLRSAIAFRGRYIGYDLSPDIVRAAQAKYGALGANATFEVRDIFGTPPIDEVDFTVICGTFNINIGDNDAYIRKALATLYPLCRQGLVFNLMSTYVDYKDPGLHYVDPEAIFSFCKTELSPAVTLRHDYELRPGGFPFEFAVCIRRCGFLPRPRLPAA